jgi:hypothetical protein
MQLALPITGPPDTWQYRTANDEKDLPYQNTQVYQIHTGSDGILQLQTPAFHRNSLGYTKCQADFSPMQYMMQPKSCSLEQLCHASRQQILLRKSIYCFLVSIWRATLLLD